MLLSLFMVGYCGVAVLCSFSAPNIPLRYAYAWLLIFSFGGLLEGGSSKQMGMGEPVKPRIEGYN